MDNMPEEEVTANELDFAGRDMLNRLKCNLIENTNVFTAIKLALEDIIPTHQADANVNPLPALTPLRYLEGRQNAPLQGQNTMKLDTPAGGLENRVAMHQVTKGRRAISSPPSLKQ